MKKRIRVGIVYGGRSAEHEVSIQSAKNVFLALDQKRYEPVLIKITKQGRWIQIPETKFLSSVSSPVLYSGKEEIRPLVLGSQKSAAICAACHLPVTGPIDVVFPVLHGPYGEDGTVQGFLKLFDVPFVGSGVLGSAVGMDKDVMKRLLRDAGLPVAKFIVVRHGEKLGFAHMKKVLGMPVFVKPANLGSSVGVNKARNRQEFNAAVKNAFAYDQKILVEECINGREIECSVLGNEYPRASLPGEVIPRHEFYSYEAKYLDPEGAALQIPAKISRTLARQIRQYALQAFTALCAEGMARVDFFLTPQQKIYINEINTIPGFTAISMYPKLWEASGVSYQKLIDTLIRLALERHKKSSLLKSVYA